MKIADMADMGTHKAGRVRTVGAWRFVDDYGTRVQPDVFRPTMVPDESVLIRRIYHYGTCMAEFRAVRIDGSIARYMGITFTPVSMGWGSVSDQGGMNKILAAAGLPLRYRRDAKGGGARYERVSA